MTTRVPLAEIRGPFQELGCAALGRKGDARRDEQRGVAVVLSSGVAEDRSVRFSAAMGIAPMAASRSAEKRALDQLDHRRCGELRRVLLLRYREGLERISARRLEFHHECVTDRPA